MQRFIPIKLDEPKGKILAEAAYEGEQYATVLEIYIPQDVVSGFITVDFHLLYDGEIFISEPIMIEEINPDEEVIIGNREVRIVRYAIPSIVTRIAGNVPFQFTATCSCDNNGNDDKVIYKSVTHLLEVKDSISANNKIKGSCDEQLGNDVEGSGKEG